jgi:hypothetical protein
MDPRVWRGSVGPRTDEAQWFYVEEVRGFTGPRQTAEARRFNVFGALEFSL